MENKKIIEETKKELIEYYMDNDQSMKTLIVDHMFDKHGSSIENLIQNSDMFVELVNLITLKEVMTADKDTSVGYYALRKDLIRYLEGLKERSKNNKNKQILDDY